jgi:REP element-mobilizing transposase RayT
MARLPRLNLPNVPQHIVQRGNNRQVTFVEADDYVVYLEKLRINGVRSCIVHFDPISLKTTLT